MRRLRELTKAWEGFWFAEDRFLHLGIFRALLCGTLFLLYLQRQSDLPQYFSDQGFLPKEKALEVMPPYQAPLFSWHFWPDSYNSLMHGFLLLGLLFLALGLGGRILTLGVFILQMAFVQRNYSVVFGGDIVATAFLFLLSGTQSCAAFTVKPWLAKHLSFLRSPTKSGMTMDTLSAACYRMIQMQLCIIYAYSGWEKLKGSTWWDGTAVWSVLANSQMVIADLTWLRSFPWVIVLFTWSTVLFEIYFPFLVLYRPTRILVLGFGVLFHVSIGILMALWSFAAIMIAPYILFLDREAVYKMFNRTGRLQTLKSL